jgi:hypothetical protein
MFTKNQLVFAVVFFLSFVVAAVIMYRKDRAMHKVYYKGSYKVLIGFLFFVALLFVMKTYLKH